MSGVPAKDGRFPGVSDIDYHQDRSSLSVSGAKLLLPPSCPAKLKQSMDEPPKPKREYDFGHLAHTLLLGKGAQIAVIDAPDFRTKDAREQRDTAHASGHIPALRSEVERAQNMAAAVREHPVAGPLFVRGHAEVSLYTTDPGTGVRLRARPDWITLHDFGGGPRNTIVDFKTSTTANPVELQRKFWTLGYWIQAAWYLRVYAAVMPDADPPAFLFAVCEKEPPHVTTIIEYDTEAISEGHRHGQRAIELFAWCSERDQWPGYADGIVPLSLPPWVVCDGVQADADTLIAELQQIQGEESA